MVTSHQQVILSTVAIPARSATLILQSFCLTSSVIHSSYHNQIARTHYCFCLQSLFEKLWDRGHWSRTVSLLTNEHRARDADRALQIRSGIIGEGAFITLDLAK
ncbi:hypothetical protein E4T56_gene813 [Termitomyces sp. T112]|nr:hypothetical protein E4T56_gene813 [Termitomyces sp. T112]